MKTYRAGSTDPEFLNIQQAAQRADPYAELEYLHAAPDRVRAGMIVLADGTDWNPGSGAGPYRRSADNTSWVFIGGGGGGGTGDVVGPASSVNNRVVFFNGVTGKLIKDSGLTLSGSNTGDQTIQLTGDVTGSGTGTFAATIAAGAVTLAKQANLAANSIIGNNTGLAATPLALTTAQVKTMLSLTSSDVGLGSVTNDAQTKAAIVPNTAPSAGQILVGNAGGTAYAPVSLSGDATLASTGVITSTGKRRLANVTLGSAGTSLASGTITACQFLEIHIYIEGYAGSDTASLQFNATAGTGYRYRWLTSAAGGTTFAAGLVAASTDRIKVAAVNTTASRRVVCHISNDASVTEKLVVFESVFGTGSAATQTSIDIGNGAWISGAATQITSVSLISTSNMTAGTQMTIYGWN